ncbi:hypothetical protein B0A50_01693 [Salinomyces thailandicus]|uniref:SH3 domain-containing protein n=1 Tax=Salinomyces thailandicus TaxID=706561 RepID=A0A4U0UAX6_9PEZI|nr:hypothetical protein B0A50_01693 [Salinomyces thailandica]
MSTHPRSPSGSRPASTTTSTTLNLNTPPSALVRDFAYPLFHPLHHGAPPEDLSGTTTPGSDWTSSRRLSDPQDVPHPSSTSSHGRGTWTAGPWGGDGGVIYDHPSAPSDPHAQGIESLPSTSFDADAEAAEGSAQGRRKYQRKSRSYGNIADFERGRRRKSAGYRRSRTSLDAEAAKSGAGGDMFLFGGSGGDPAGRASLRLSRGFGVSSPPGTTAADSGALARSRSRRKDSHFASTLPNRSFHSQPPTHHVPTLEDSTIYDEDLTIPLDLTVPTSSVSSPQRTSMVPEDEELYAGQSLVLYDFVPENANELRLREGQVIMVSYRHGQGWLVAEDAASGEQGLVPEAYVRLLSDLPHYNVETGLFEGVEEEGKGDGGEGVEVVGVGDGSGEREEDRGKDDEETGSETDAETETEILAAGLEKEVRVDSGQ